MKSYRMNSPGPGLFLAVLLAACVTQPAPDVPPPAVVLEVEAEVDANDVVPLLVYFQRLLRMSAQELVRERNVLAVLTPSPANQVRLAMLLGQVRGPMDLYRALALLETVLKSGDPAAATLHPLARTLANQYQERLKVEMQNEKLTQQLKESLRRSGELQEKLDALADIERSLPVRPNPADNLPGPLR
jgi:hypothetical protein